MENMFEYLVPHAICLSLEPLLIWLLVIFNGGIALAYFIIPLALLKYLRIIGPSTITYMFAIFILGCGFTHVMQIVTMYIGGISYWVEMLVCGITFIASACTAMVLLTQGQRIMDFRSSLIRNQSDTKDT